MPSAHLNLNETYETIHRPVIMTITSQMIKHAGLDSDNDLRISFRGDINVSKDILAALGRDQSTTDKYGSEEKLSISVTEKDIPGTNQHKRSVRGQPIIWLDPDLKSYSHLIYSKKEVEIAFTYRSDSRNELESIRSNLTALYSNRKEVVPHEIEYDIQIPKPMVMILAEIYKLKEIPKPSGKNVGQYINDNFTIKPTVYTDTANKNATLGFKEKQSNIQGMFDIQEIPTPQHLELGVQYTLEFSYRFIYSKPMSLYFKYPFVIHSNVLDSRYYSVEPNYDYIKIGHNSSEYNKNLDKFKHHNQAWLERRDGIVNPIYDDEPFIKIPKGYKLISRDLFLMEEGDNHIFNIKDAMGNYNISDKVIDILIKDSSKCFEYFGSYFLFVITENDKIMSSTQLTMDEQGDVYSSEPIDITKTYRVYFYVLRDYTSLSAAAVDRMINEPEDTLFIMDMVDPTLKERDLLPKSIANTKLVKSDFYNAVNNMNVKQEMRWHKDKLIQNQINQGYLLAYKVE